MCICCGAAFGMVLSSLPIFGLIPLVAFLGRYGWGDAGERHLPDGVMDDQSGPLPHGRGSVPLPPSPSAPSPLRPSAALTPRGLKSAARFGNAYDWWSWFKITTAGVLLGALVYLITNPYIVINAFGNREVLRSNFSNSLAMYDISRIGAGFVRVLELTTEGATLPLLILGTVALVVAVWKRRVGMLPLAVPALVLFVQFVLIGAGKPAEYGRFGVFTNTALAIGTACVLGRRWTTKLRDVVNWLPVLPVVLWVWIAGALYLLGFVADEGTENTRLVLARSMNSDAYSRTYEQVALFQEPAPYCCPPLPFAQHPVLLFMHKRDEQAEVIVPATTVYFRPMDAEPDRYQFFRYQYYAEPGATFSRRVVVLMSPFYSHMTFGGGSYDLFNAAWGGSLLCGSPAPISWANKSLAVYGSFMPCPFLPSIPYVHDDLKLTNEP